jgi:iron complex outermembrane receptor protein
VDDEDIWRFMNKGTAKAKGFGFEFESRWQSGFGLRANYSYQLARDGETGTQLAHSSRQLAGANILMPVVPRKILTGLDLHYAGPARTVAGTFTNGFIVPNLTFPSPVRPGSLDFSAGIYNLFNSTYGYAGNEEHIQNVLNQDGRTFRIQLGYTWGGEN